MPTISHTRILTSDSRSAHKKASTRSLTFPHTRQEGLEASNTAATLCGQKPWFCFYISGSYPTTNEVESMDQKTRRNEKRCHVLPTRNSTVYNLPEKQSQKVSNFPDYLSVFFSFTPPLDTPPSPFDIEHCRRSLLP